MEITHKINHSQYDLNKYSGAPWEQRSLLKSNIIFRETPTQDDGLFYYKQVQEMPLRTLAETVAYQGQVHKEEVLPRHRYKETRILLINTVAFS